ncbi:molecular chaperone [Buttiauxella sp. A2-C2_NF]|uniref:fimbrial biogenesis chaperone n=1 Tax=Buttiauxella ferragutiae TaxID=82989 RepID=UPI001E4EDC21|nr:molecular chaperone [Buttiauxella ferragutiae]MCE0824439.1 molecular chaperone [Buttiauxella ferragutiae]
MKFIPGTLLVAMLVSTCAAQAGVVVGGTRLIYDGARKESSLSVSNPDKQPFLIQSWVEMEKGGSEKAPFVVTPPLFRLDGGQNNVLRVVRAGGNLPSDKESLYWMNIKAIPSADVAANINTLQIAVKTRIKLIYRPQGLKGVPEEMTDKLSWHRSGNNIQVSNPTPFYMNFMDVKVAGKSVQDVTYVAPGGTASFAMPVGASSGSVTWTIISDYGAIGPEHKSSL